MNEDTLNIVLAKINDLNKLFLDNKDSSTKILMYLANKAKELDAKVIANEKDIILVKSDINDIVEAENNSYNEIQSLKAEVLKIKDLQNKQNAKIKELESKLSKYKEENKIDELKVEQAKIQDAINSLNKQINAINEDISEKLIETKDYILFDRNNYEMSKFRKFIYKIFHYREIKRLELQKQEEEKIRQEEIKQELERKKQEEAEKIIEKRNQIKDILNSTKKT
jgi:hypothetical protein